MRHRADPRNLPRNLPWNQRHVLGRTSSKGIRTPSTSSHGLTRSEVMAVCVDIIYFLFKAAVTDGHKVTGPISHTSLNVERANKGGTIFVSWPMLLYKASPRVFFLVGFLLSFGQSLLQQFCIHGGGSCPLLL